jgi:hypothetical protein
VPPCLHAEEEAAGPCMPKKKPPARRRRVGPEGMYDRAMKALAAKEGGGKGAAAEVPDPSSSSEEDEGDYGARKCGGDVLAGVLEEGGAGATGAPKRMRKKLKRLSVGVRSHERACSVCQTRPARFPTLPLCDALNVTWVCAVFAAGAGEPHHVQVQGDQGRRGLAR